MAEASGRIMTDLTYKGFQVPWVTRWTEEEPSSAPAQVTLDEHGEPVVGYRDGVEFRDEHGVLWLREGIRRGGEPQFAQVSAYRQRAAMLHRRCQVCGRRIAERLIRWLMDPVQLTHLRDGTALTFSPPTCSSCVDIALNACPHLRSNDRLILSVLEYRIWGVWGDMVRLNPDEPEPKVQYAKRVNISYDRPDLAAAIAKQQIVQLTKFTIEKGAS